MVKNLMYECAKVDKQYWKKLRWRPRNETLTARICEEIVDHIADKDLMQERKERLSPLEMVDLHTAESALKHALKTSGGKDMPIGIIKGFRVNENHFLGRDIQGDAGDEAKDNPEENVFYFRADYGESLNCPMGPDEAQDWWFAGARWTMSNLVIVCWRKGFRDLVSMSL